MKVTRLAIRWAIGYSGDMAKPFQFRLRTIFLLTALVAVICLLTPPIWEHFRPPRIVKEGQWRQYPMIGVGRMVHWSDGTTNLESMTADHLATTKKLTVQPVQTEE